VRLTAFVPEAGLMEDVDPELGARRTDPRVQTDGRVIGRRGLDLPVGGKVERDAMVRRLEAVRRLRRGERPRGREGESQGDEGRSSHLRRSGWRRRGTGGGALAAAAFSCSAWAASTFAMRSFRSSGV